MLTSLPRSENRINGTRCREILVESHLPARLFVRPVRYAINEATAKARAAKANPSVCVKSTHTEKPKRTITAVAKDSQLPEREIHLAQEIKKVDPVVFAMVNDDNNENRDRRSFGGNASPWYQAVLRIPDKIEPALLRTKNVLASLLSRSRAMARQIASRIARVQIPDINRTRIILIKEDTPLPSTVSIENEAFLPGWRTVKNPDWQALTREVVAANLKLSYLAGEIRATIFWRKGLRSLRRAAECVLARQEQQHFKFNSLEFTKVVSKRFLGIPVTSVTVHSRCIQQGLGLAAPQILS